jgi:citrate lyase beta subunit
MGTHLEAEAAQLAPALAQIDYKNEPGLTAEALEGREVGFAGKQVIHPSQIAPVQVRSAGHAATTCAAPAGMVVSLEAVSEDVLRCT